MSYQRTLKIIVLGESGVGKTSLLLRYKDGTFKEKTKFTVVDRVHKCIEVNNQNIMLELWDTAGFDRYRSISKSYFRGKDGVLLIYDVTNMTTFSKLEPWLKELREENKTATVIIVGNKNEDPDRKMVNRSQVKNYARDEGLNYIETSAKSGENVNKVFETLVMKILQDETSSKAYAVESEAEDALTLLSQNGTDCTDSSNNRVRDLPPVVSLPDDSVIKLVAEKDKLRKMDDDCCVIL